MRDSKAIALDFYCANDEVCKSKYCICGEDVCPYLRGKLFDPKLLGKIKKAVSGKKKVANQIKEKKELRALRRDNMERTLRDMKGE